MAVDARNRIEREYLVLIEAIEATSGAVAIYDASDRLIVCNTTYREIHAEGFAALAGASDIHYADLMRPTIAREVPPDAVEAALAERVATHRAADGIARDRHYPGHGWLRVIKTRTPSGGVAGFATDITRLKETEADLRAARARVEEAFRARGRFVAALSHELRNPLNAMLGIAEAIAEGRGGDLGALRVAGRAMAALLDDVLDHARLDSGRLDARSEQFDAGALVAELQQLYGGWARAQGLGFTVEAGGLAGAMVEAPRRLILQAAGNLLSNAIKFTRAGTVALRAGLRREGESARLRISVEDTGPGMSAAQVSALFAEFAQLPEGASSDLRGSGLGLSIARGYAEAMGGTLTADSAPGRGARFEIDLPVTPVAPVPGIVAPGLDVGAALPAPVPAETPTDEVLPIEVLAAEDNQVNQIVLKGMLARLPVNLTMVENGALAVDAARARRFDVILMDSQMPVMDGLTAVRLIRAHEREAGLAPTRIVSVSANAMPEFARDCVAAGVDDQITKPIDLGKLRDTVLAARRTEERRA